MIALHGYALLGALVGLVVGAVEILQRYRDAPFRAVFNLWGVGYVLLNAAISYGTFWVAYHWAGTPPAAASAESNTLQLLGLSATAGFGGAAVIRARLTSIRLPNGQEFGIGPAIVIETLLSIVDRQLDRQLATARYNTVHQLMEGIDFEKAKMRLPKELFLAMQSIPEDEAAQVARRIDEIDSMDGLSSQDKSYFLGFYLFDLVGKEFLTSVLNNPKFRSEYLLQETVQGPLSPAIFLQHQVAVADQRTAGVGWCPEPRSSRRDESHGRRLARSADAGRQAARHGRRRPSARRPLTGQARIW